MEKRWEEPRLIVLTRGNPEEAVLTGCKATLVQGGSQVNDVNCIENDVNCAICSGLDSS